VKSDFLKGRWLKHPLHPMIVHLPIGLWLLGGIFDVASRVASEQPWLVRGAFYTTLFGVIGAALAAVPGFVDYSDIRADHPAKRVAAWHMRLNLAAVALYVLGLVLRYPELDASRTPAPALILSLLALAIVMFSGYLGGVLVYDNGIGVGRHRRATDTPRRTVKVERRPPTDDFIDVASVDDCPDRHTLRADVNGHVMVIANVGGTFYAVQEFCTHRFGPMSEGAFCDGAVLQCPWHRSKFDLRDGKVAEGPAKMDLRTYEVNVEAGRIRVRVRDESNAK
jgi:nitrite reductase/ring-hydroxylating ferredoxin subunit/uncharacterized membrane protein